VEAGEALGPLQSPDKRVERSDEVFVVRIASWAATSSASAKRARFGSTASSIVSMTRAAPVSASFAEIVSSTG
jgi:hypothetical protein